MRWLLKNPAPSDHRREKWGDFHFGRSLTKYLERAGDTVLTQYDPGWDVDVDVDAVLVLRGKYPFPPSELHAGATRVMWNISHPADVPLDEYATYDLVLVASHTLTDRLTPKLDVPVHAFLQCTDLEEFDVDADQRRGVVFVGNTREVERPGVLWALDYGLPLRLWGRGWGKYGASGHVVADYLPNEELGSTYSSAFATLNDHWDDMKSSGFINNRILDALASGTPVVSDWHPELVEILPSDGILLYRDRAEFDDCMTQLLLDHPRLLAGAAATREVIRERFSFEARARDLRQAITDLRT